MKFGPVGAGPAAHACDLPCRGVHRLVSWRRLAAEGKAQEAEDALYDMIDSGRKSGGINCPR